MEGWFCWCFLLRGMFGNEWGKVCRYVVIDWLFKLNGGARSSE